MHRHYKLRTKESEEKLFFSLIKNPAQILEKQTAKNWLSIISSLNIKEKVYAFGMCLVSFH